MLVNLLVFLRYEKMNIVSSMNLTLSFEMFQNYLRHLFPLKCPGLLGLSQDLMSIHTLEHLLLKCSEIVIDIHFLLNV